jgi:hypothetical protein
LRTWVLLLDKRWRGLEKGLSLVGVPSQHSCYEHQLGLLSHCVVSLWVRQVTSLTETCTFSLIAPRESLGQPSHMLFVSRWADWTSAFSTHGLHLVSDLHEWQLIYHLWSRFSRLLMQWDVGTATWLPQNPKSPFLLVRIDK